MSKVNVKLSVALQFIEKSIEMGKIDNALAMLRDMIEQATKNEKGETEDAT